MLIFGLNILKTIEEGFFFNNFLINNVLETINNTFFYTLSFFNKEFINFLNLFFFKNISDQPFVFLQNFYYQENKISFIYRSLRF